MADDTFRSLAPMAWLGLDIISDVRTWSRRLGVVSDGPSLVELIARTEAAELPPPGPGETYLCGLINRTHGDSPTRPDPFDDHIGIWHHHGPEEVEPLQQPGVEYSRAPDGGLYSWWATLGTCEPGWAPMHRRGGIETHPDGCARFAAPQLARDSHGGGFHFWRADRPAFRQVGDALIQRYDPTTGTWSEPFASSIAAHAHSIPLSADWRTLQGRGVGDISHACLVPLIIARHKRLLKLGGWTSDIEGCRLSLLTLDLSTPVEGVPVYTRPFRRRSFRSVSR